MQKKKHQKTQIEVKRNRFKNINNITDSLKSPQRQIRDPKLLRNEMKHIHYLQKKK